MVSPATTRPRGVATLRNVQGLRGVAALIVVMAHVSGSGGFEGRVFGSSWTERANLPANAGVDLFFVISGLIMVVTTWRTFDEPGSARRFLWRRITRIYPLYWLVNTAVVALYVLRPNSVGFTSEHPSIFASYVLLPQVGRMPLLVAWSLVYEMFFYVSFTLALLLRRRYFGWFALAWVTLLMSTHLLVGHTDNPYVRLVASPLSLEFVAGGLIGYALVRGWMFAPRSVLLIGTVAFLADLMFLGASGWAVWPTEWSRVLTTGIPAAIVVYGACACETTSRRVVPTAVQGLGDRSYSLYLIHVPMLTLLAKTWSHILPTDDVLHAVALLAIPIYVVTGAWVCHRFLELPIQQFFRSRSRGAPPPRPFVRPEASGQPST
jgi:peptidoglycan/LPS O-acetylase OafA/YrhL